jgi:hypothetical protein
MGLTLARRVAALSHSKQLCGNAARQAADHRT